MRRKSILGFILILVLTLSVLGLTACGGDVKGTYYLYMGGNYIKSDYIKLDDKTWTDDSGEQGTYEIKDGVIYIYSELFGEKELISNGTVKDGVIAVNFLGIDVYYCKEGSAPSGKNDNSGENQDTGVKATVTYDANGGVFADSSATLSQSANIGTKLTAPESPTRKNYNFNGWAKNKNGSDIWNFATDNLKTNLTLYAVWQQQSAIILSVEGASIEDREIFMFVENNVETVSLSNKIICSADSTWRLYYDKMGQTEIPTKIASTPSGELKSGENLFYIVVSSQSGAQVNVYTINIYRNYAVPVVYYDGLTQLKIDYANTGKTFTANYTPTINGYTFNGWQTESGKDFVSETVWQPLMLYAKKTANTYTVTLNVNGGDALSNTEYSVTFDKSFSLPVPKQAGYLFDGWAYNDTTLTAADGKSISAWNYSSDLTLIAVWGYPFDFEKNNDNYIIIGIKDKTIKNIIVPDFITQISEGAFSGCSSLESITIPFVGRSRETSTYYPFGYIFGKERYIGSTATEQIDSQTCYNIYYVPNTLKSVTINGNLPFSSFYNCSNLTNIIIGKDVASIAGNPFSGCSGLMSITVTGGNKKYHSSGDCLIETESKTLISGCKNSIIPTDGSVTSINNAFSGCTSLTSITIPDSVTSIKVGAFFGCTSLTNVTIGNSVSYIAGQAFDNCSSLTSITIPDSVKMIEKWVFHGCSSLNRIIFKNTSGWQVSKDYGTSYSALFTSSSLENTSTAATYLTTTYMDYYWRCSS